MTWVALKMLMGNSNRYLSMIGGAATAAFLIAQQLSVFCGAVLQTATPVWDAKDAEIWVMDPNIRFFDEFRHLPESQVFRTRSVEGIDWAVPYLYVVAEAKSPNGNVHTIDAIGLDDASLVGAPRQMIVGSVDALAAPDAVIIDEAAYRMFWPDEPLLVGKQFELNDRRAVVVGVCKQSPTLQVFPFAYTRYTNAKALAFGKRRSINYVLACAKAGVPADTVCNRIKSQTGLKAFTRQQFAWATMLYHMRSTGLLVNFAVTTFLGLLVGISLCGVTFHLFITENLRQFGVLKAMGVTNGRLVGMALTQAAVVAATGYGTGVGFSVFCGELMDRTSKLAFYMPYQVLAGTALATVSIVVLVSLLSIRSVLRLEPGLVIRR